MRKLNKSGGMSLMTQVIAIIIAAICVFFLFYLAFKLYGITNSNKQLEQAKSSLEGLSGKLMLGEVGSKGEFLYLAPLGWNLMSFDAQSSPLSCKSDFCICLCSDDKCQKNVACDKSPKMVKFNGKGKRSCFSNDPSTLNTKSGTPIAPGLYVDNTLEGAYSVCLEKISSLNYEIQDDSIEVLL